MKALLVIDMQKGYVEKYDPALTDSVNRRIQSAEDNGEKVIYVMNVRKLKSGRVVNAPADGLLIVSPNVLEKTHSSVFEEPELTELMQKEQITQLEIIGIDGCCCVASSAIAARSLGYEVSIPLSSVGVKNAERFEKKVAALKKQGVCFV